MGHLTSRRLTPEMMDDPNADPRELARALVFIRFVNRSSPFGLGGASAAIGHLREWSRNWPRGQTIRILDVGTGSADIPLAILRWADRTGHDVRITGVDLHATTLAIARNQIGDQKRIELLRADALKLHERFDPGSFDYAHAGMFLHHLQDIEVVTMLRIMDRLSARGVIWNDLIRSGVARAAVRAFAFGVPRMARHDAIVSFQAAFTRREALDLAQRAGLEKPQWRRHLVYRFTLVSEKSVERPKSECKPPSPYGREELDA